MRSREKDEEEKFCRRHRICSNFDEKFSLANIQSFFLSVRAPEHLLYRLSIWIFIVFCLLSTHNCSTASQTTKYCALCLKLSSSLFYSFDQIEFLIEIFEYVKNQAHSSKRTKKVKRYKHTHIDTQNHIGQAGNMLIAQSIDHFRALRCRGRKIKIHSSESLCASVCVCLCVKKCGKQSRIFVLVSQVFACAPPSMNQLLSVCVCFLQNPLIKFPTSSSPAHTHTHIHPLANKNIIHSLRHWTQIETLNL